jgi:hypothetical protein
MTPLDKAKQILAEINTYAIAVGHSIPIRQYTQVGALVVDGCESMAIALSATVPDAAFGPLQCNVSQNSTFSIYLMRSCSWSSDQEGITIISILESSSAIVDADGQFLWNFANQYQEYLSKSWTLQYSLLDAGVGVSLLTLVTGVD